MSTRMQFGERMLLAVALLLASFPCGFVALAQETWGDIPPEKLKEMVLLDFIKGTSDEKKTLDVLKILNVDPGRRLLAVIYRRSGDSSDSDSELGVKIILDGQGSLELSAVSRTIVEYSGIGRTDGPPLSEVSDSKRGREEAEGLARRLGDALGIKLDEVKTEIELTENAVWDVNFYQLFDGYLCPGNVFTVTINAKPESIRLFIVRPFITEAQTKIMVDKVSATSKAVGIVKAKHAEYKGKDVKGQVTVDQPWMYPAGVQTNDNGDYVGPLGRLVWPVYIEGSGLIVYIDCQTGKVFGETE